MSVQQGMNCACAAASGTVVPGQIVQDTAIRRKYPQEITAFPCKSEHECENKTYPANDIKEKSKVLSVRNIFEIFMEIMLANEWEKVQPVLTFSDNVNIITMKN